MEWVSQFSNLKASIQLCLIISVSSSSSSSVSLEYLDNMEKLDLSYNQLASLGPGAFRGLSRLRQLYLHNNKLTVVQQGSLDMLPGLEVCVANCCVYHTVFTPFI